MEHARVNGVELAYEVSGTGAPVLQDRPAGWAAVRVPCLVIAFEHDLYLPPRVGREAAQAMPAGRFAEVVGATHSGHFEHADRVNRLLVDFLDAQ